MLSPSSGSFTKLINNASVVSTNEQKQLSSSDETISEDSCSAVVPRSALFVPGRLAQNLTPFVIPSYQLSRLDAPRMEANLKARKYTEVKSLQPLVDAGLELESLEDQLARVGAHACRQVRARIPTLLGQIDNCLTDFKKSATLESPD